MRIIYIDVKNNNLNSKYKNTLGTDDFEFTLQDSFSRRFANAFIENYEEHKIEVWSCYNPRVWGDRGVQQLQKNNVKFLGFPYTDIISYGFCFSLIKHLQDEINSKSKIIVVLQNLHSYNNYMIIRKCKKIPLVIQQRSHIPPVFKNSIFKMWSAYTPKIRYPVQNLIESMYFSNIDFLFANGYLSEAFFSKIYGPNKSVRLHNTGYNFKKSQKRNIKREIKESAKINILAISRFTKIKGAREIILAYNKLKKILPCKLFFVGPTKGKNHDAKLMDLAKKSGVIIQGYVPNQELLKFMRKMHINWAYHSGIHAFFGGLTSSSIESMSMNVPQISNQLVNFPSEDYSKIGLYAKNHEDIVEMTIDLINNLESFDDVYDEAKKYYDWKNITKIHEAKYKALFNSYYISKKEKHNHGL